MKLDSSAYSNSLIERSDPDCLHRYLHEIARLPVLTAFQERRLARRAARGDRAARRQFISANLRLVAKIAMRYSGYGIPTCDLIQEGNLGLIKASERFDWRRGTRFSTYAAYWIRDAITLALTAGGRAVRLTGHAFRQFRRIAETAESLAASRHREPTLSEIAAAAQTTTARAARFLSAAAFPVAMDGEWLDGSEPMALDLLHDATGDPAEFDDVATRSRLRHAIDTVLNLREQWIIIRCFGLDRDEPVTLKEMARQLGVSPERVRQIRMRAVAKLRHALASESS